MSLNSGTARHRVLMIAYSYYESDPRVIREAEAAVEGGFDVDFLTLRRPGSLPTEIVRGVRVIRLNQAKYRGRNHAWYMLAYLEFFFRCFVKCTWLFVKHGYCVMHVNNMPDFLVFSTIIPRLLGASVILDIHDSMPNTFSSKFKKREGGAIFRILLWQERLSAAYSNQVITVHEPVKQRVLMEHGLAGDSIEVIANFADSRLFPLRNPFTIDGKLRFVFHGTIVERSGLRILLQAVSRVRHKHRISVKIIGEGDFSEHLKEMIRTLQLDHIVDFDNCSYPAHTIAEHMQDCHVGLVPLEISSATNYALPLKLLEYISLGLPVLTVHNEAIDYYFDDGDCMFFKLNDPKSLTNALDRIVDTPEILQRYRKRSLELRDRFSWTSEKIKYIALLQRLANTA